MGLRELLNKIFRKRKQEDLENRRLTDNIYEVNESTPASKERFKRITDQITAKQQIEEQLIEEGDKRKKIYILIGVVIVVVTTVIALAGVIYTRLKNSAFSENKVRVTISGSTNVSVGDEVSYKITIKNDNRIDLQGGLLTLNFSPNFRLKNTSLIDKKSLTGYKIIIGKIPKFKEKSYTLDFDVDYSSAEHQIIRAEFEYQPININSKFIASLTKTIALQKSNLGILISLPTSVSNGEVVKISFKVKNEESELKKNLLLKIDYPEEFIISTKENEEMINSGNLDISGKKWNIGDLAPNQEKELQIVGEVVSDSEAIKKIRAVLLDRNNSRRIFSITEKSFEIIPPKLLIKQENDHETVNPGDLVKYKISFKNNSSAILKNLILRTHLPDRHIIPSEIRSSNGYFDRDKNILIWKAGDNKQLAGLKPGESGQVEFRLRIKKPIPFDGGKNKNPSVAIYSEMESLDIDSPFYENKKIVSKRLTNRINSVVNLRTLVKVLPEDNGGREINKLMVGQEVNLRIALELFNTTNDLENVKLTANFPAGISWIRQVDSGSNNLSFNNYSNHLEWSLGIVKAGTGYDGNSPQRVEFVIKTIPSDNQLGQAITLIKDINVSGKDTFSGQQVGFNFDKLTSKNVDGLINYAVTSIAK